MIKIGVEVGQNTYSPLDIHDADITLETWRQNLSFKPQCVDEKSPVEHHFPSGVLCCLLFHLFLFNPTTDRRNSTTVIMLLRTLWRDDAGNNETHANYKEGKRCEVKESIKIASRQWKELWKSISDSEDWPGVSPPTCCVRRPPAPQRAPPLEAPKPGPGGSAAGPLGSETATTPVEGEKKKIINVGLQTTFTDKRSGTVSNAGVQ